MADKGILVGAEDIFCEGRDDRAKAGYNEGLYDSTNDKIWIL